MCKRVARKIVRCFDTLVRHAQGIYEFTQDEGCILRLGRGYCRRTIRLSDGTVVRAGDPVLEIHLWNERVPPMPAGGADATWGIRFVRRWKHSLRLLAEYWRGTSNLANLKALHGVFALPGGEGANMRERALRTMGFDIVHPRQTPWHRFTTFWENLYNWAILWTYNPASLRVRHLLRLERVHLWMSWGRVLGPGSAGR